MRSWTGTYREYLRSPHWRSLRQWALTRANGLCERCEWNPATEVHHLTYRRLGCELPDDLVAICRDCHEHEHRTTKRSVVAPPRDHHPRPEEPSEVPFATERERARQRLEDLDRGYEEWVINGVTIHRPVTPADKWELARLKERAGVATSEAEQR